VPVAVHVVPPRLDRQEMFEGFTCKLRCVSHSRVVSIPEPKLLSLAERFIAPHRLPPS